MPATPDFPANLTLSWDHQAELAKAAQLWQSFLTKPKIRSRTDITIKGTTPLGSFEVGYGVDMKGFFLGPVSVESKDHKARIFLEGEEHATKKGDSLGGTYTGLTITTSPTYSIKFTGRRCFGHRPIFRHLYKSRNPLGQ